MAIRLILLCLLVSTAHAQVQPYPTPSSGCTLANPTGTVGLTVVNGVASTCMRSDAAPPLSQGIAPTMTGDWIFSPSAGVGVTINGVSGSSGLQVNTTGVQIGSPTGADQGLGTINVAGGYYLNGTLQTAPTGANPSGTVGLTVVNGSAATFMRSDAAPPLSVAIVPTWTGVHTFSATPVFNAGETLVNAANAYTQTSTGLSLTSGATGFGRDITGTVNDSTAVDGIIDFANITCTLCTATSYLVDWQVGGSSVFKVSTTGVETVSGLISNSGVNVAGGFAFQITGRGILTSTGAGNWQLGNANAASPVAQSISTQGTIGGTTSNGAGANLTIASGLGTGNATGSLLILQTPHATTTGTTQQVATTQISLGDNTVSMPNLASSSVATTGTVCWTTGGNLTVDTTLACLASTKKIKQNIQPLNAGLDEVMALRPVSYDLKPKYNPKGLGPMVGLVAEEVQKVDPRLVGLDANGDPQGVRYMQLTAVLIKALQEQQQEISQLRRQLKRMH